MSGFFEAMGLTKPAQPQQPPQGQSNNQPAGPNSASSGQNPNPQNDPNQGRQPNGQPTPNSNVNGSNEIPDPLAAYAKMWDTTPTQEDQAPTFNLDPKLLDQVAGGLDFTKGVNQELMQKATSGDIQSLVQLMNEVARNAYRQSLQHGSTLTDKFVGLREEHFGKRVPNVVREELTMGALSGNDGAQMSPAARKQLAVIAKQYSKQNPDASPQEVAAAAKKYVSDMYMALNPNAAQGNNANGGNNSQGQANAPFDWDAWADQQ